MNSSAGSSDRMGDREYAVATYRHDMAEMLKKGEEGMLRYLDAGRIPPDALFVLDPERQRVRRKRSFWSFGRGG